MGLTSGFKTLTWGSAIIQVFVMGLLVSAMLLAIETFNSYGLSIYLIELKS